jgi:enoyl-CoA hydratase/carnithine racemase
VTNLPPLQRTKLSRIKGTAVVALASNKVNALDVEAFREITMIVDHCENEPEIDALVMTGEGSVFSAGLDVNEVLANDPHYTEDLLGALEEALVCIFACPIPTVVAINGSAIAGGCLLACAFDKRLIADEARIGVTELRVGVSFPMVAVELLRHVCGSSAERLMFDAELLDADAACRYGLAHARLPRSELQAAAVAAAEQLASLDARAYALAKKSARRMMLSTLEEEGSKALDRQVLDHWQDEQTRASLERLLTPKA